MCHFITLIVPTDDTDALAAIMKRHDRDAWTVNNPCLGKLLQPGDRQYLTTRQQCDCGTVLGQKPDPIQDAKQAAREVARLRRKRWSPARIARLMESRAAAGDKKPDGSEEIDLWMAVLDDLKASLRLSHAGLFVHFYSGGLEDEDLIPVRRLIRSHEDRREALVDMNEDELMVFRLTA